MHAWGIQEGTQCHALQPSEAPPSGRTDPAAAVTLVAQALHSRQLYIMHGFLLRILSH